MVGSRRPRTKTDSKRQIHDANASGRTEFTGTPIAGWQLIAFRVGRIVSVSGLRRAAFPALACKSGAHHPWRARSAGRRFTGPSPLSASPLPAPTRGSAMDRDVRVPRAHGCARAAFGCTHPRLDRRGGKKRKTRINKGTTHPTDC